MEKDHFIVRLKSITLKNIKSLQNKIICCILYVPGVIKTKNKFKL